MVRIPENPVIDDKQRQIQMLQQQAQEMQPEPYIDDINAILIPDYLGMIHQNMQAAVKMLQVWVSQNPIMMKSLNIEGPVNQYGGTAVDVVNFVASITRLVWNSPFQLTVNEGIHSRLRADEMRVFNDSYLRWREHIGAVPGKLDVGTEIAWVEENAKEIEPVTFLKAAQYKYTMERRMSQIPIIEMFTRFRSPEAGKKPWKDQTDLEKKRIG
jgi:hypothetical protein